MPVYEYRCNDCRKRFDVRMSYAEYGTRPVVCTWCGSMHVDRKIGRVRVARSDEAHLEAMADPASMADFENDPKAMARMMRTMSSQMGEDMGAEFDEVVGRLERGEDPEAIERDMPNLGTAEGE